MPSCKQALDHWDLPIQGQVRYRGPEWLLNLTSSLPGHEGSMLEADLVYEERVHAQQETYTV
jgi:hypothetical protein